MPNVDFWVTVFPESYPSCRAGWVEHWWCIFLKLCKKYVIRWSWLEIMACHRVTSYSACKTHVRHRTKILMEFCTLNKNHWMDKANPWSQGCKRNSLSNERIFMILPPQHFLGWIKRDVGVHFNQENTVEVSLEGNSLVKSSRYWIVISFHEGIFRPNRPVFNLMILYGLDSPQLTQEKEKKAQWLGVLLGDSKIIS